MDNKKLVDQTPPTQATPVQPVAFPNTPADPPIVAQTNTISGGSGQAPKKSNINIWLMGGVVTLVLILTGVYFYLSQTAKTQPTPTPQPVSQKQQEDLESELNSLDVESEGNDFAEVDKDIQGL